MTFRTNEEVRITGVLGTASNSTVTCSKVINWRDGSGNEYDASRTNATVKIYTSKSNYEYGVCSASGGTLTFTMKGLDASNSKTEVTSNKKQWRPGAKVAYVASASDLVDLDGDNTFTGTQTFTEDILFTGTANPGIRPRGLTTAQMNALDMTGIDSAIIYNTTESEHYQYIGGSWSAVSAGSTQANASTTVAGKVEQATPEQGVAGTATGETGAPLFSTPADLATTIQSGSWVYCASTTGSDTYTANLTPSLTAYTTGMLLPCKFTTTNTGSCSININGLGAKNIKTLDGNDPQTGVIRANGVALLQYDGTNMVIMSSDFATTSNKGIVEMATDAEALAGTDEVRYVNPKQNKRSVDIITGTRAGSSTGSQTLTHNLGKTPIFIYAIAKTNGYYISSFGMWCSEGNSSVSDFSSAVAIEPSLSDSLLINTSTISGNRSLNCTVTSVNTTDIVVNRTTSGSSGSIYDVGYTFFVFG